MFEGMRRAPVSVLAPFEYTSLVWAFALGYLTPAQVYVADDPTGAPRVIGIHRP